MAVINVTEEAHARAKEMARQAGVSIGAWASGVLETPAVTPGDDWRYPELLVAAAKERGEDPGDTLQKALAALATPPAVVVPQKKNSEVWADGLPPCKCDGEPQAGPWHKPKCHRRI